MEKINSTIIKLILAFPFFLFPLLSYSQSPNQAIILYTPYTSRSITPGKSLDYHIDVINTTDHIQQISFSLRDIPGSWNPSLSAGANTIQEVAVKPKSLGTNTEKIKLDLKIPLKIRKGRYHFKLIGTTENGTKYVLPLRVYVTKKGVFETELKVRQANMEGNANSHFNYNVTLSNRTGQKQNYALISDAPPGWDIRFRANGDNVTSVNIASNKSQSIFVKVTPPPKVKAGKYKIHIQATSGNTSDQATLESVIQGKYGMNLTTPSGRLSTNITAGNKKVIKLLLRNSGTLPLRDIKLSSSAPANWNVDYNKSKIALLNPGKSEIIHATVTASNKAIAGDYQLQFTANTSNATSKAQFRITVSKSFTTGFVGLVIIFIVIGGIAFLFKKYGRR